MCVSQTVSLFSDNVFVCVCVCVCLHHCHLSHPTCVCVWVCVCVCLHHCHLSHPTCVCLCLCMCVCVCVCVCVAQAGDATFNRAKLLNVGYLEALKEQPWDCFIFHDVHQIGT